MMEIATFQGKNTLKRKHSLIECHRPLCIFLFLAIIVELILVWIFWLSPPSKEYDELRKNSLFPEVLNVPNKCPPGVYKHFPAQINSSSAILLFQNSLWQRQINHSSLKRCSHLPVLCEWTMNRTRYNQADAVVYHFPDPWFPPDANKLSIGVSLEAQLDHLHRFYPTTNEASRWKYNVSSTYELKSEIPYVCFELKLLEEGLKKRPVFNDMIPAASAFFSNCRPHSQRQEISKLLEEQIPVYFYGKCLNSIKWPENVSRHDVKRVMGKYMLNFSFENTIADDYVTEKVLNALASGTIPVYHGTNTIDKFLPSPDSIIRVSEFGSLKDLGEYLLKVVSTKELFDFHHSWRYKELPEDLLYRFNFTKEHLTCRICKYVYSRKFGCLWDQKIQQIGSLERLSASY